MHSLDQLLQLLRKHKPVLEEKYSIAELGVFGSYARHEAGLGSDIDILVSFSNSNVGLSFIRLAMDLEDILQAKVDLVSKRAIQPKYWPFVQKDLIYV